MTEQPRGFSWKNRRRVIFASLLFCAVFVAFVILRGHDDALNQAALLYLTSFAGGVVGSYVFGAAWENRGSK
ncbi:hypothetical protein BMI91_19570 [Thioclava sediminum]|uniref:Uncharacterized protein n=1 Tax=Thioclava sediminum TaxID=1915319 RepID=A0ABX3MS12_9RHOB|nr:hypothetical protein [Thioclava sediminum]OOY22483.1 hypothetical protein BMI91_19570 [Thioclava sediminum]